MRRLGIMDTTKTKLGSSFGWLNATQFLGALNDNVFKLLIILFLIGPEKNPEIASRIAAIAGAVFVMPFLLFTAFAGKLADRFSKRNIIVSTKAAEIAVMLIGCLAFKFNNSFAVYCVLFFMCTQSAFFGPSKYGIVPELVKQEQLSRANGLLEALTYFAIVIGTASGLMLTKITNERYVMMGLMCVAIAVIGLMVSLPIERTPPAGGKKKASIFFIRDIWQTLRGIRQNKDLILAVSASAYFKLIGGFLYTNLIPYGMGQLGLDKQQSGQLFVIAAIGIGIGAFWAGKLSGRHVELGVVPLGAIGLALSSVGLGIISENMYIIFALILLMGISAGLFIVPIHALIQLRSPTKQRGQILAASGFLGWVGVLLASGLIYCFINLWGISAGQVFMILGVMTLVPTIATIMILPDFLVRFLCVLLTRLFYRIKVTGLSNVPMDKPVLLVSNHVSWVDALLLAATQQRRIRFIMDRQFYNIWWLRPICKLMAVIPISAKDPPKKIVTSLRQARQAMDEGFMVCIFAEGAITRSGMLRRFRAGFQRIVRGSSYEIIPIYIGGAWGSIFSYSHGKILGSLPKKFPYPVSIHFGKPMSADSSVSRIRQKVSELSCEYINSLKSDKRSLAYYLAKAARKNWHRRCISDTTGKDLNYGTTFTSTIALAKEIEKTTTSQQNIGILLPPSVAGSLTNMSVTMLNKVAVNLNYSTGPEIIKYAVERCDIKSIISSRSFIEKIGIPQDLPGLIFIEDIVSRITGMAKFKAYLKASFMPISLLTKGCRCGDDLATIIFSSGSSGKPKGVMQSHHNIISNIEALQMVIKLKANDNLAVVLPFFHSFGFNCGLWLPLVSGVSASYIPNPLDGSMVAQSIRKNRSTILFAAPTFLLNYIRRAQRPDFASLRMVASGAEKLKKRLAESFEAKFGIRPFEGYGATELSPVASLNIPNVESDGIYQVGNKLDSVGHPLPGVAVKIVDIESKKPLDVGEEGLLMVKGPNIMLGYLNAEEQTAQVVEAGWYNTGDIARIDEDGFLTITDRLSRFSKIGGEMVPHVSIEDTYLHALGMAEQVIAVTSVPDPKKGEELVVLYLKKAGKPKKLHKIITNSDLPNIWKPKPNNYIKIDSIPVLGSGKIDVMKLKKIALTAKKDSGD